MTRRLDLLGPALALVAGVVFLLRGFDGVLTRDLALYAYAGQQVADGVPPYVGVMNRSGPLAHLVPGAGAWLGDLLSVDDLLATGGTMAATCELVEHSGAKVLGCRFLIELGGEPIIENVSFELQRGELATVLAPAKA